MGQTRVADESVEGKAIQASHPGLDPNQVAALQGLPGAVDRLMQLEAENATLRLQRGSFIHLADSAIDHAIILMDGNGNIIGWNRGAEHIIGYPEAEALGRSGEIIFTPEDRAEDRFTFELRRAAEAGFAINERWHLRRDGSRFWASGTMTPVLDDEHRPLGFLNIMRDRSAAQAEREQREMLLAEMNHRIKNNLAMVQAVAAQTRRHTTSPAEFQTAFEGRLQALSRSHDVLMDRSWEPTPLCDIITAALAPYDNNGGEITLAGPPVLVPANLVVSATLIFHELATNAVKHGAFSVPCGQLNVAWSAAPVYAPHQFDIVWRERGGPPVQQPTRRGFGSKMLQQGLPSGLTARTYFQPEGLECQITLVLDPPLH